jgi:hypothetical protein
VGDRKFVTTIELEVDQQIGNDEIKKKKKKKSSETK